MANYSFSVPLPPPPPPPPQNWVTDRVVGGQLVICRPCQLSQSAATKSTAPTACNLFDYKCALAADMF